MAQSIAANFWNRVTHPFGRSGAAEGLLEDGNGVAPSIGDRYAQTTQGAPVWIVENVLSVTASRYPLVKLTNEKYPDMLKIVSISTLADHAEFTRAH